MSLRTGVVFGFAAVLLAGCSRAPDSTPAVTPPAPAAVAPAAEPVAHTGVTQAMPPPEFVGDFAGTLPCADCSGIDTGLTLLPDNTYTISETLVGKEGKREESGMWKASDDGKRLQLAAEDSENARYFAIVSPDELRMLDQSGNPIADSKVNITLKRKAPPPPP
jgi:copper homeostasis protein (lipoprotein)